MIFIIHCDIGYDITKDIERTWNISRGKLHLRGYQVAEQKRKVQEQYPDPITRQMLPSMTLNIHVVEVGCIISGHFKGRRG